MHRMQRCRLVLALAVALCAGGILQPRAQEPDPSLTFEVASVKSSPAAGPVMMRIMPQGERFTASHVSLLTLLGIAHQVKLHQIIGQPAWAASEFFDVQAKASAGTPLTMAPGGGPALSAMLRNLLADRFALRTHRETRELPVYALLRAREDGKLGSGLTPSKTDCEALMKAARAAGGPPPFAPPKPGERPPCGVMMGPGRLSVGGMPITTFVNMVEGQAGRIVIDRTGLTGTFDVDMTFTPDFIANQPAGSPPPQFNGQTIDSNGPTLFTAIQEQLGLKLDATKAPVEVLVIDSVSRPTPD